MGNEDGAFGMVVVTEWNVNYPRRVQFITYMLLTLKLTLRHAIIAMCLRSLARVTIIVLAAVYIVQVQVSRTSTYVELIRDLGQTAQV